MTKQRLNSFLSKVITRGKSLSTKLVTAYLGVCCGLMLLGAIQLFQIDKIDSLAAETYINCTVVETVNGYKKEVKKDCSQIAECQNLPSTGGRILGTDTNIINCGTPSATTPTPGSKPKDKCTLSDNTVINCEDFNDADKKPTDTPNLGSTKPSSGTSATPTTTTKVDTTLPKLTLVEGTTKDPCEGIYAKQVTQNSKIFDCFLNPVPAFTDKGELSTTQPARRDYIDALCARTIDTRTYSSPSTNQKWTCSASKLSGNITNIIDIKPPDKVIKRSQVDQWLKDQKKSETIKPPVDGADYLGKNLGCGLNKTNIRLVDLPNLGNFTPIIPINCNTTSDGYAIPLSPMIAMQVIIRLFGFLCGFVFYLINFVLVYNGLMWIYGGIDGKSQVTAKRNIGDLVWALVLLLGAYVIISTIVGLIGAAQVQTDLTTFFNINTKI